MIRRTFLALAAAFLLETDGEAQDLFTLKPIYARQAGRPTIEGLLRRAGGHE